MASKGTKEPYTTSERRGLIALLVLICLLAAVALWRLDGHPLVQPDAPTARPLVIAPSAPRDSTPATAAKAKKSGRKANKQKAKPTGPQERPFLDQPVSDNK